MTIEDENLPVKVCINDTKLQLKKISLNNTGYGGWDQGEIRLIGKPDDWKSKTSRKLQAALTMDLGSCRMSYERKNTNSKKEKCLWQ